jgi:hypothetical protein
MREHENPKELIVQDLNPVTKEIDKDIEPHKEIDQKEPQKEPQKETEKEELEKNSPKNTEKDTDKSKEDDNNEPEKKKERTSCWKKVQRRPDSTNNISQSVISPRRNTSQKEITRKIQNSTTKLSSSEVSPTKDFDRKDSDDLKSISSPTFKSMKSKLLDNPAVTTSTPKANSPRTPITPSSKSPRDLISLSFKSMDDDNENEILISEIEMLPEHLIDNIKKIESDKKDLDKKESDKLKKSLKKPKRQNITYSDKQYDSEQEIQDDLQKGNHTEAKRSLKDKWKKKKKLEDLKLDGITNNRSSPRTDTPHNNNEYEPIPKEMEIDLNDQTLKKPLNQRQQKIMDVWTKFNELYIHTMEPLHNTQK